jgi:undecaprenyl diphosphate synthase
MGLLRIYLNRELPELVREGVRLKFIGDRDRLSRDVVDLIGESEKTTEANSRLTVVVALNYGSRNEIVQAARRLAESAIDGKLLPGDIDESVFSRELTTAGIPDPDLLIRTSGEQRLSNFLLWQSAYTELVFSPVLWPDFGPDDLDAAISEFQRRERRYGASSG